MRDKIYIECNSPLQMHSWMKSCWIEHKTNIHTSELVDNIQSRQPVYRNDRYYHGRGGAIIWQYLGIKQHLHPLFIVHLRPWMWFPVLDPEYHWYTALEASVSVIDGPFILNIIFSCNEDMYLFLRQMTTGWTVWDFCPSRPVLGPTQSPVQWVPGLSRG